MLNRGVASFDEASTRESLEQWVRERNFTYVHEQPGVCWHGAARCSHVFGNDFRLVSVTLVHLVSVST